MDLEKFLGGQPNIVGIKVAQLNVLLELQLRTSLVISQVLVKSANTRVSKSRLGGTLLLPPLNPPMCYSIQLMDVYICQPIYPHYLGLMHM